MAEEEKKRKAGRPPGAENTKTKNERLYIDPDTLDPPPVHRKNGEWKEDQAIKELEFLIRFLDNDDPKKVFPGQCLSYRGYRNPNLYDYLAKKFPGKCLPLWDFAKMTQQNKVATMSLMKNYDSRFGVFAMQNISGWRQTQQVDVATNVKINARDYKGVQPVINDRINKKKKTE